MLIRDARDATALDWGKAAGLLPAIVQDAFDGRVLMLAWMNPDALERSLGSGFVTFWSRSRRQLWTKGDTSGNRLREICEKVLRRDFFKPPSTSEDFYYDGFANYLLGRHDRARYDYERSAGFFETYYDELGA